MGDVNPLLGILCGMEDEARALGRWRGDQRVMVRLSTGRVGRAEMAVAEFTDAGVRGIVSWGVCGGLDPALRPGDLVECRPGDVYAATGVLRTRTEKAAARAGGGRIVDLESAAVARSGVPGLAMRAVLDEAGFALPAPALVPLREDGRADVGRIAVAVLGRPASLPGMLGLAWRYRQALGTLRGAAGRIDAFLKDLER